MIAAPDGFRRTLVLENSIRTLFSRSGPNYPSTESGELQRKPRRSSRSPRFLSTSENR